MPNVANGDIIEVIWDMRLAGQVVMAIFHYKVTDAGGGAEVGVWSEAYAAALQDAGGPVLSVFEQMSSDLTLHSTRVQDIYPTRYAYRLKLPDDPINGAVDEAALPPADTVCITKQGPLAGHHQHGTVHFPGAPVTAVTNGLLTATYAADLNDQFDWLPLQLEQGGITLRPVIFNRDNPPASVEFDHYTVEDEVRTMKRRVVGRGI